MIYQGDALPTGTSECETPMKVKASVKRRCEKCKVIRRQATSSVKVDEMLGLVIHLVVR
jgi:ribosomal protein L36